MIFPERVLGRSVVKMIPCGRAILPIFVATCARSSVAIASSPSWLDFRVTKATIASHQVVRSRDDGGLGDLVVVHEGGFDLEGRQPVTGDVHHVVDPSEEPEVSVVVTLRSVTGDVHLGSVLREVRPDVSVGISQIVREMAGHGRVSTRYPPTEGTGAFVIEDVGPDPREGDRRRTGLELREPRQRRDEDRAGLGLPPGVDDRCRSPPITFQYQTQASGLIGVAHGSEEPDRGEIVLLGELVLPIA